MHVLKDTLCNSGEIELLGPMATLGKECLLKCLLVDIVPTDLPRKLNVCLTALPFVRNALTNCHPR